LFRIVSIHSVVHDFSKIRRLAKISGLAEFDLVGLTHGACRNLWAATHTSTVARPTD